MNYLLGGGGGRNKARRLNRSLGQGEVNQNSFHVISESIGESTGIGQEGSKGSSTWRDGSEVIRKGIGRSKNRGREGGPRNLPCAGPKPANKKKDTRSGGTDDIPLRGGKDP